ncbi:segregation/condensation protein A [Anoxybacillus sp. J5B_2022]|uniref:segregation/condensation protein A n=1 Tax=Anoxybacillus sp. J5B_2022 TaxID=3003246 RepID=UPI00228618A0|nr:segregation/condensation protein A [Anoxybacillus sp. J5B_2022]
MQYKVKIEAFEGPLDLLLHLINRYEIDIYNIPVAEITEQYMAYIHAMQELQLDVASEYLVMAATLLAMKSKMLLPKHEEELFDGEIEEEDPREQLMHRLLEYKKYKEAAQELKKREEERALLFTKPPSDLSMYAAEDIEKRPLEVNVYDMLLALSKLLRRKKLQKPLHTKIARQEIPIERRMEEILTELRKTKKRKNFFDLFPYYDREYVVVTFLALLELMKKNLVTIEQERNFADIFVVCKEGEHGV